MSLTIFRKVILRLLVLLPISSISFAAQAVDNISEYDGLLKNKKLKGMSLYIHGVEYDLESVLNSKEDALVNGVPIFFIQDNKEDILNGNIEGIHIDKSIMFKQEAASISGFVPR